jgi:hypothetical protein
MSIAIGYLSFFSNIGLIKTTKNVNNLTKLGYNLASTSQKSIRANRAPRINKGTGNPAFKMAGNVLFNL